MHQITKERLRLFRAINYAKKKQPVTKSEIINKIYNEIKNDKNKHFLAISNSDPGMVSFAAKSPNKYNVIGRVKTNLARYIRRKLSISIDQMDDASLNSFVEAVREYVLGKNKNILDNKIQIVSGEAIRKKYFELDRVVHSCMSRTHPERLNLYVNNPDKVQLVVGDNSSRALLWKCDDGEVVLDRVYPVDSNAKNTIIAWAKEKKLKTFRLHDGYCLAIADSKKITLKFVKPVPYIDSVPYGELKNDKIVLSNNHLNGSLVLQRTDGNYLIIEKCVSCNGRDLIDNFQMLNGDRYCYGCYNRMFFTCQECRVIQLKSEMIDNSIYICKKCNEKSKKCSLCENGKLYEKVQFMVKCGGKNKICCYDCHMKASLCFFCGCRSIDLQQKIENELVCTSCFKKSIKCKKCNKNSFNHRKLRSDVNTMIDICLTCFDNMKTYQCNYCKIWFDQKEHCKKSRIEYYDYYNRRKTKTIYTCEICLNKKTV